MPAKAKTSRKKNVVVKKPVDTEKVEKKEVKKITKPRQETAPNGLNAKQYLFCQLYVSKDFFGNGLQAYAEAYDIDLTERGKVGVAKSAAHRLLTNVDIMKTIRDMLDHAVLNDNFVDREMAFCIQQSADMATKARMITEYNKLRSRIKEKITIEHEYASKTDKEIAEEIEKRKAALKK